MPVVSALHGQLTHITDRTFNVAQSQGVVICLLTAFMSAGVNVDCLMLFVIINTFMPSPIKYKVGSFLEVKFECHKELKWR